MDLSLANVFTASVSASQTGVGKKSPNTLALFTREAFGEGFGDDGYKIYLEPIEVGTDFGTDSVTYAMAVAAFSQEPNFLLPGGYLVIIPFSDDDESVEAALTRTDGLVQWFAMMCAELTLEGDMLASAAVVQAQLKMAFWPFLDEADVAPGGAADQLRSGSFDRNRAIFRNDAVELNVLTQMAAYAGRALSTDFTGSNTTQTMHLKDLKTIQPDPGMTQTLLNTAKDAGADCFVSLEGVSKVFTSGENVFFDRIYNRLAYLNDIVTAGFNVLAQVGTKIAQTEEGIDQLKDAQGDVCDQYVRNQFMAPGEWTDPSTFGNQADFLRNIRERGYYIYSTPLALQLASARAARQAPLVQIAVKEAGAVHSANTIININP